MHSSEHVANDQQRFEGRFSDGATASSHIVDVRISDGHLVIEGSDGSAVDRWPLMKLAAAEPLRSNSVDALLSLRGQQDATVFVTGNAFVRALSRAAPHLGASAERWRNFLPWLAAAAGIVAVVLVVHFLELSPARYVASAIPDNVRTRLGSQIVSGMTGTRRVCVAPEGTAALNKLVARLAHAVGSDTTFRVTVVDWGLVNAFAAPGEQILITRGLITGARSADELAGVVAHEIGHGLSRHPETAIVRSIGLMAAVELMTGGGGGTAGNLGVFLAQRSYTRGAEREADDYALRILRKAEISPDGLAGFFRRMSRFKSTKGDDDDGAESSSGTSADGLDLLSTHPAPNDRFLRIKRIEDYPTRPALEPFDWAAVRAVCSVTESAGGTGSEPSSRDTDAQDANASREGQPGGSDDTKSYNQVPQNK